MTGPRHNRATQSKGTQADAKDAEINRLFDQLESAQADVNQLRVHHQEYEERDPRRRGGGGF